MINSSSSPLVSVIIPCFNYGRFLTETVNSALGSTYKNIEIIIVDDGSTEKQTSEVLEMLKNNPSIKVIHHHQNKGLPASRNTGIREANGKYIMPLDADDMIHSKLIEKGVKVLEKYPKVGFLSTGVKAFGDANWVHIPPKFNFYKHLFRNQVVDSLFRKIAWIDAGGYNEKMTQGYEDWDFWISVAKYGWQCYRIPKVLYYYRKHGRSFIDEALEKHQQLIEQIRGNHPELYDPQNLEELRQIWGEK